MQVEDIGAASVGDDGYIRIEVKGYANGHEDGEIAMHYRMASNLADLIGFALQDYQARIREDALREMQEEANPDTHYDTFEDEADAALKLGDYR